MRTLPVLALGLAFATTTLAGCLDLGGADVELITTAEAQQLLEAGSALESAAQSDKRVRIDGGGSGFPDEFGMGAMKMTFVLQLDPARDAASYDLEMTAGIVNIQAGIAQVGEVLNLRFRDVVYVGRDASPENLFAGGLFGGGEDDGEEFDALLAGNFDFLFRNHEGFTVDAVEATTWKGKAAFRITAHATEPGQDWDGDGTADHGGGRVELDYVVDAVTKRPYVLLSRGPTLEGATPVFEATFAYGSAVDIRVTTEGERFPFTMNVVEERTTENGRTVVEGRVADHHTQEVRLAEVEMRAVTWSGARYAYDDRWAYDEETDSTYDGSSGDGSNAGTWGTSFDTYRSSGIEYEVLAQMRLDAGALQSGDYAFAYDDADGDGLVSAGDTYRLEAPESAYAQVAFYDLWADAPEGDLTNMVPGFGFAAFAFALGLVGLGRRLAGRRSK